MKRKICAVTANRADFSRIQTMLEAIQKHPDLELQLIVMGSHLLEKSGMTVNVIEKAGFKIDQKIYMEVSGDNPATMTKSVGLAIVELTTAFDRLKPDIVLTPVDRFESMAIGTAAALMNIHVAHTQGGEVTGTIDESIRHALTKLSHLHFAATEKSRERIIKLGELPESVFNIGCPGTDLLLRAPKLNRKATIKQLNTLVKIGPKFNPNKPFLLAVQHPVTTEFGNASKQMIETMEAIKNTDEETILLWPNIDAGSDMISRVIRDYASENPKINIIKHIPTEFFANILRNASCVIGNSSSGVREACYFGTPVVNIGSRQNSRERGSNVIDTGYNRKEISAAIRKQLAHGKYPIEQIYGDGTAGKQFAKICATIKLPNIQKKITY